MKPIILMSSLLLLNTLVTEVKAAACPTTGQVTNVASTFETAEFTFTRLHNTGDWVTVAGLKLTTPNGTIYNTANAVANAFASKDNGYIYTNPPFTGALAGWNSGKVSSSVKVIFTATTTGNVTDISTSNRSATPSVYRTQGTGTPGGSSSTLSSLLTGNTVCVGATGHWEAQEFHKSGGSLIDWKQGTGNAIDPTTQVGTWSLTGTGAAAKVNYNYTGGSSSSYSYTVFDNGNKSYSFCSGGNVIVTGTIKTGQTGC